MGVWFSSSEARGWSHSTSPCFSSNLSNFCQAHHSPAYSSQHSPHMTVLMGIWDLHLQTQAQDSLRCYVAFSILLVRAGIHGLCLCPGRRLGLWFLCSGERWAAAHTWAAATVRNKHTKVVTHTTVPTGRNRAPGDLFTETQILLLPELGCTSSNSLQHIWVSKKKYGPAAGN